MNSTNYNSWKAENELFFLYAEFFSAVDEGVFSFGGIPVLDEVERISDNMILSIFIMSAWFE